MRIILLSSPMIVMSTSGCMESSKTQTKNVMADAAPPLLAANRQGSLQNVSVLHLLPGDYNLLLLPGLVFAHPHLESSLVTRQSEYVLHHLHA
jgi:hypothetical protein